MVCKQLKPLQNHADAISDIKLGAWWRICLSIITPVVLGYMMYDNLRQNLLKEYGDYPREFIFNFGWTVAIGVIVVATLMGIKRWKEDQLQLPVSSNQKEVS